VSRRIAGFPSHKPLSWPRDSTRGPTPLYTHRHPGNGLPALRSLPSPASEPSAAAAPGTSILQERHLAPCPAPPSVLDVACVPAAFPVALAPTAPQLGAGGPPLDSFQLLLRCRRNLPLQLLPSPCNVPVTQLHRGPSAWLVQICSQPPLSSHQSDPEHKERRRRPEQCSRTPSPDPGQPKMHAPRYKNGSHESTPVTRSRRGTPSCHARREDATGTQRGSGHRLNPKAAPSRMLTSLQGPLGKTERSIHSTDGLSASRQRGARVSWWTPG